MQKYTKVFFGLLLASALLPAVALASSLTGEQIQSIIGLLQSFGADSATIANVQTSLAGGTPNTTQTGISGIPAGFSFYRNLSLGSAGQDVSYLKTILASENCFSALTSNTGFGPLTQAGVKCFQAKYGISPAGAIGPVTLSKLNSLISGISYQQCNTDADCPQVETTNTTTPVERCINGRCVLQQGNCTPNWTCGWGPCLNGYQSETAVDSYNCGLSSSNANIACPALAKVCGVSSSITISSVYGPNSLNIGQVGTWNISATAPSGTSLNYSVDWGDTVYAMPMASGSTNTNISQTSTFTHSYSQAGTYTVKFTVSAPSVCATGGMMFPCFQGGSATSSITVVVGNQAQSSINVISPNGSETLKVGQVYYILWNSSGLNSSDDVSISLYTNMTCPTNVVGCQSNYSISSGLVKNTGNYRWDTSAKMGGSSTGPNSISVVPGFGYRVVICDGNTCGYSNYFSIAAQ